MTSNLVIGSDGFLGRWFCDFLAREGQEVTRFDVKRSDAEDGRTARYDLEGIDRVYFLAWDVGGSKYLYSDASQLHQLEWNLELLRNSMPQLQESGLPFVFASTQLAENCDLPYGVTKRLGEVWTSLIDGVSVRLWNVYGAYEEVTERSHVIADFVHQGLREGEIRLLTTGEEERQFIHADDISAGLIQAMEDGSRGAVYDLSPGDWTSVRRAADLIAENTGAAVVPGTEQGSHFQVEERPPLPNWSPSVGFEEGVRRTVRLYRERMSGS
jgi:nucleoside-diphosphate-sugar epimerase